MCVVCQKYFIVTLVQRSDSPLEKSAGLNLRVSEVLDFNSSLQEIR